MLYRLVVWFVRRFPVGVLLDALPPIRASLERGDKSQVRYAFWYRGGLGRHVIAKLGRSGPCYALLTVGDTELEFDVFNEARSLATLRIREKHFEPDHQDEEHDVDQCGDSEIQQ